MRHLEKKPGGGSRHLGSVLGYLEPSPKNLPKNFPKEDPITEEFRGKAYDPNIQIPAVIASYLTPSFKTRDARVLDMISSYLSSGKISILSKYLVDKESFHIK